MRHTRLRVFGRVPVAMKFGGKPYCNWAGECSMKSAVEGAKVECG